jgi:HAE1 family hydrophobic/amphiphilic exporter-1
MCCEIARRTWAFKSRTSPVLSSCLVGGLKAGNYEEGGETYDVHVRAALEDRSSAERLRLLTVPSTRVGNVPLGAIVRQVSSEVPAQINRSNRQRQVPMGANVRPGFGVNEVRAAFEQAIAQESLPAGYRVEPALRTKEEGRAFNAFVIALALSFIFMYLVLAAQLRAGYIPSRP